jgi:hypothetical protein
MYKIDIKKGAGHKAGSFVVLLAVPIGFDLAMRKKNRSVESIESAHSMPCCYKHLKGLEPLNTPFDCFRICISSQ